MTELQHDTPSRGVESGSYSLALYSGLGELGKLQNIWRQLADTLSHKRYFHLYSWYRSYLESLEKDPEAVSFLVISRGNAPVAVFPLKRSVRKICGLRFRCLEIPSHPHMNLGDFIFERNDANAALVREMAKNIRRLTGSNWDLIHVPSALEDSAVAYALDKAPVSLSVTTLTGKSNHVDCRPPYVQVEEKFKGHFRRNLRRLYRRTEEWGKLQYQSYSSAEDIRRYFPEFLRVEASGWKGERGTKTAIACEPSTLAFYQQVVEDFSASGECRLNLLTLNGNCIAGQLCLFVDNMPYILKIGFDEAFADIAPGNLIMGEMIRQCANDATIQAVSFVTDREWNFNWGATSTPVYTHNIFNQATLRGWLGYLVCRSKKTIKQLLSATFRKEKPPRRQDPL